MVGATMHLSSILRDINVSYSEQLQRIVQEYRDAGQSWPATPNEMAAWAIEQEKWSPQRIDLVKQCARQISQAMREEYITDPQGRSVRAKHCRRVEQTTFWDDIRTADREHMEVSFTQRRHHIFGECRQLRTDVCSYNENVCQDDPIQMSFDFTRDLEEADAIAVEA